MAIELEFIPLDADELPVSKIMTIGNQYRFVWRYNTQADRISVEIYDLDDNLLYTTRLIYGNYLLHAVVENLTFEAPVIPFNIDDLFTDGVIEDTTVIYNNLTRVKQYVVAQ
jgi:hypothetical protein